MSRKVRFCHALRGRPGLGLLTAWCMDSNPVIERNMYPPQFLFFAMCACVCETMSSQLRHVVFLQIKYPLSTNFIQFSVREKTGF